MNSLGQRNARFGIAERFSANVGNDYAFFCFVAATRREGRVGGRHEDDRHLAVDGVEERRAVVREGWPDDGVDALVEQLLGDALRGRRIGEDVLDDVLDVLAAHAAGVVDEVDLDLRGTLDEAKARLTPAPEAASSKTATSWPSRTGAPSAMRISTTRPASGATTGISIFMDSSTMRVSSACRVSPGFTRIFHTVPVISERILVCVVMVGVPRCMSVRAAWRRMHELYSTF